MGVALSLCARPLEARILRPLAKGMSDRPESAKEVLTELEAVDFQEISPEFGPTQESGQVLDRLAGAAVRDNDRLDWLTRLEGVAFDPSAAGSGRSP